MLKIFIGYDHRQPVSYNVLHQSILERATKPISITPIVLNTLPIERQGLTPFSYSRFMVPYLCDYKGVALFIDCDMILQADISELFSLYEDRYQLQVVKSGLRFEWSSVMLFNCAGCKMLTPEFVDSENGIHLMNWADRDRVGDLPSEWNHLVGYDEPRDDAKLVHFTQGVPAFSETRHCEYSDEWEGEWKRINSAYPWEELMGGSVHAVKKDGKMLPRLHNQK